MSQRRIFTTYFALAALALCYVLFTQTPSHAGDAVSLEVGADTPFVEVGETRRVVVRALVRPSDVVRKHRAPLAVALVLDKSGSMRSDRKMENAKLGAMEAIYTLDGRDIATVVVYDSQASVLVPPRKAADRMLFRNAVSEIDSGGSTALYDGVQAGARALSPFVSEGYVPRIVLLSDGMANVGPSSTRELANLGRSLAEREITITSIGLGLDYNEDLMTALAAESGGNAYFAKNSDMLPEIFARDMDDAVTLSARRVRVTLSCQGGARVIRSIGRTGVTMGNAVEVAIDNLYGAEKYALFEVELPKTATESTIDAAKVTLEYVDPKTGHTVIAVAPLEITRTKDAEAVRKNRVVEIAAQAEMAKNAEIREAVVRMADEGRAKEAARMLKNRTSDLRQMAPAMAAAAPEMKSEAESFESLAQDLEESGSMSGEARKKTVNKAYTQKNQQADTSSDKK